MKILVTGGAGFIGSNFVRRTLQDAYPGLEGAEVVVLDALTYSGNLANLAPGGRLAAVHASCTATSATPRCSTRCCPASTPSCTSPPSRTSTARCATRHLRRDQRARHPAAARRGAPPRRRSASCTSSTDEVYGSIAEGSWTEEHALEPNSPYSASKAGSDLLARSYHRTHGLNVSITRCSNNYGPYHFPEKVIPLFVTNLHRRQARAALRRGRERARLAARRRPLAAASRWCSRRAAPARSTTSAAAPSSPTGSSRSCCSMRPGSDWSYVDRVEDRMGHDLRYSRRHRQDPRRARLRAAACRSNRASPTSCSGTATTASGGSRSRSAPRSPLTRRHREARARSHSATTSR